MISRTRLWAVAVAGVLALVGLGVGASAASAATPTDGGSDVVSTSPTVDGLRVRMGPGTDHDVLGQIYAGDLVEVVATAHDWTGQQWDEVMLQRDSAGGLPGGYIGWVSETYLDL